MFIFTVLFSRSPEALKRFVQTAKDCGATGVTIFTRPSIIGDSTLAEESTLSEEIDAAAARKDYRGAANAQQRLDTLKAEARDRSAVWLKEACEPIKEITQVIALGGLQWDAAKPFNTENFMADLPKISTTLLTTGVGGIVQKTPLNQRTFIPLTLEAAEALPAANPAAPKTTEFVRHSSIPAILTEKEAEYAQYRLGLDRGGQRRSKNEAGNKMSYSANISGKMDAAVARKWPQYVTMISEEATQIT